MDQIPHVKKKDGIPEFLKVIKFPTGEEEQGVKAKMNEFISETSVAALTRIHRSTSNGKRVMWIIVFFGMFAYMTFQIITLCQQYFNYPVELKITLRTAHVLEFPAVTICNINPVRKEQLMHSDLNTLLPKIDLSVDDQLYQRAIHSVETEWKHRDMENNHTAIVNGKMY